MTAPPPDSQPSGPPSGQPPFQPRPCESSDGHDPSAQSRPQGEPQPQPQDLEQDEQQDQAEDNPAEPDQHQPNPLDPAAQLDGPDRLDKQAHLDRPTQFDKSSQPTGPDQPDEPVRPDEPDQPDEPVRLDESAQHGEQNPLNESAQPDESSPANPPNPPGEPGEPSQPSQPSQPDHADTPDQSPVPPARPSVPAETFAKPGALPKLLARLAEAHDPTLLPALPEPPDWSEPLLRDLVYAFMIWEASAGQAANAMRRIESTLVDHNELRVHLTEEVTRLIGERYPRSRERAERLKAAMQEVFEREHTLSLEHLRETTPDEARAYLDSLEGMPPFVSSRLTLLSLRGRAFPVDGRICALLIGESVCEGRTTLEGLAAWLEEQIPPEEAPTAYNLMEAWCEVNPSARRRRTPRSAPRTARRTSAGQNDE